MFASRSLALRCAKRAAPLRLMSQARVFTTRSWFPSTDTEMQQMTEQSLVHRLMQRQVDSANILVPWFLRSMPESYFRQVDEVGRLDHLRALSALHGNDTDLTLSLKSKNEVTGEKAVTMIRPSNHVGMLAEMMTQLQKDDHGGSMVRAQVFTSLDSSLCLNIFSFHKGQPQYQVSDDLLNPILDYAAQVKNGELEGTPYEKYAPAPGPYLERDELHRILSKCDPAHLASSGIHRSLNHIAMYSRVDGTESTVVEVHPLNYPEASVDETKKWITVAVHNVLPMAYMDSISHLFRAKEFDVIRAYLNVIPSDHEGTVVVMRFLADTKDWSENKMTSLVSDIRRLQWIDKSTFDLAMSHPGLGINRAEILTALRGMTQAYLYKSNPLSHSLANTHTLMRNPRFLSHAAAIADMFIARFSPGRHLSESELEGMVQKVVEDAEKEIQDPVTVDVLRMMAEAVQNIYRTNYFLENRFALSMRVKPEFLHHPTESRSVPYGVFFVHGNHFNGFHVRFRDIARGGLRIVTPKTSEAFLQATARHYDEVFSLAYAQQLKNKDIPEGGSKAVIMVDTLGMRKHAQHLTMRESVRAFTDSILDLIVEDDITRANIVNYYPDKEILYLGPDEQVIPQDIVWMVDRAAYRGLPLPNSFISSKAENGFNHKEYGVTSEGVIVFLGVALKRINIDPTKDTFTIKLTGGPDGDVGGNCMKILYREYGERCRLVGIADGSGLAEDPNGLEWEELLRLVKADLPIAEFNPSKLGPRGLVHSAETTEGATLRNTMHNRVVADAFVTGGGRPNTISEGNWQQFLLPDGSPSSKLIVEGANLFVSAEARKALFDEAGVMIVKDSSANKCGVICSSYEIICSMLLSKEEFVAVKEELVAGVIAQLHKFARLEAELLFREYAAHSGALPQFSEQISRVINRVQDCLVEHFKTLSDEEMTKLIPVFEEHLPAKLRELAADRIATQVPIPYLRNAVASCLASHIVYQEGSVYTNTISDRHIVPTVLKYHETERYISGLATQLEEGSLSPEMTAEVVHLLRHGGVRTLLQTRD